RTSPSGRRGPARCAGPRSSPGGLGEGLAGEAVDRPLVLGAGPQRLVKGDGRGVPVQDGPLDAAVAAVVGDPGQFGEEGLAVPVAAEPRLYVQVIQIDDDRADPR